MGFEPDEEILQDFLVEAGEILELLSEQLIELEQNPDDRDLLNAIFRGFHTVKGGAGFLQLDTLVECCHIAENVFDRLRNGEIQISSELMDTVLQTLDTVNRMFEQVKAREKPDRADPSLLAALQALADGQVAPAHASHAVEAEPEPAPESSESEVISDEEFDHLLDALEEPAAASPSVPASAAASHSSAAAGDEITDDEFEALLDQLHGPGQFSGPAAQAPAPSAPTAPAAAAGDEITDDEFEALLDQLHGPGKFSGPGAAPSAPAASPAAKPAAGSGGGDEITDDEFDALLDELHGSGKGPGVKGATEKPSVKSGQSAAASAAVPGPKAPAKPPAGEAGTKAGGASNNAQARVSPPVPKGAPPTPPAAEVKARPAPAEPAPPAAAKAAAGGGDSSGNIATETTVRVDTRRLDDIMNMVGELVLVRNRLKRLGEEFADEAMSKTVSNLDVVTSDLQSAVMQTRMQPIKKVFGRFPRVVRDLARNLKKEVNLVLKGEETDLDKNLVEALSDPLVHLVRNAVDHGVETPEKREAAGKSRAGRVVLSAEQEGDHILLSIEDDGGGMDPKVLRAKAVEKGLYDQDAADRLTDQEAFNLIFAPGFSTKTEISDVSGRGVGMDVVKTKITQLNGTLAIDSELGRGSSIIIKVPLTLAIMPTLMVMLGEQAFAFPLVSVVEIFHLDLTRTNIVDGQECIVVRENVFPLFHVKRWLVKGASMEPYTDTGHVVIVAVGTKRVGLVVDQLVGQEEVVIKPLGRMLHGTPGMAGATITGDGRIALIIDIPSLLGRYAKSSRVFGRPKRRHQRHIDDKHTGLEASA